MREASRDGDHEGFGFGPAKREKKFLERGLWGRGVGERKRGWGLREGFVFYSMTRWAVCGF